MKPLRMLLLLYPLDPRAPDGHDWEQSPYSSSASDAHSVQFWTTDIKQIRHWH